MKASKVNTLITITLALATLASCGRRITAQQYANSTHIDEYNIYYSKKTGWAGPPSYQYDIYKNKRFVSFGISSGSDTCQLRLKESNVLFIDFNLCDATKKVHADSKKPIDHFEVDSILISPVENLLKRMKFSERQAKYFIKCWNKASPIGYKRLGKGRDFSITVYTKDALRTFLTLNNFISEDGDWEYKLKEDALPQWDSLQ